MMEGQHNNNNNNAGDGTPEPDKKRRKLSSGDDPLGSLRQKHNPFTLPETLIARVLFLLPLHERYILREVCTCAKKVVAEHLHALQRVDLSRYPGIFGEDLEALLPICAGAVFLDISNCKYISYETASKVASSYPKLVLKVDQSLFQNKQRIKKDSHFMHSLYKLAWGEESFNARIMAQFSNLAKLELSNCEANFGVGTSPPLPRLRFLKVTQVTFTKALSLFTILNATTDLEVLIIRDCSGVSENDLDPITENKHLVKLVLRGCSMKRATWTNLPLSLKKLGVYELPHFDDAEDVIPKVIAAAPKLKSLILGVPLTNDDFMETLSQFKSVFANITKLFIGDSVDDRGCVITEDGLTQCGQLFPNCIKLLFAGVESFTAFGAFTRTEELQLFGGSYEPAELQQLITSNSIEKLTLEHVEPDDEGDLPLIIKSATLESFTTSAADFDITVDDCPSLRSIQVSNQSVTFASPPPKLEYLSMPWPEEEEEFETIINAITASNTPFFQQIMFSNFDGGLEELSPFF